VPGRRRQKRTDRSKLDATPPWEGRARHEPTVTTGPYDERDAPADERQRIDLGAVRIPVGNAYDVRLDLNEAQQVISATLSGREGTMQLGVFAAPRNEGIWDDVRAEIAESLNAQRRGSATEADGPFGAELRAELPADSGKGTVPARFLGVDGPRWFIRALIAGPVANDPIKVKPFEEAFRGCVVVRGSEPLPVRDPVPLQLPSDIELPSPPE
jgi:hypothetical protein